MRRYPVLLSAGFTAVVLAVAIYAGPLNPPAGPILPTYKTLAEVEPRTLVNAVNTPGDAANVYKITQPGSYYLGADLAGVTGKNGILITASRVALDLNGFHLVGVSGSLNGIVSSGAGGSDITITNGSVSAWGQVGIDVSSASACHLSQLTAASNAGIGIRLGSISDATRCIASTNTGAGFVASTAVTFTQCESYSNTAQGFSVGFSITLKGCAAYNNTGTGFLTSALCNLSDCVAGFNRAEGISVNNGSTVSHCTVLGSTSDGIRCTYGALIINNNCDQNGDSGGSGAGIHATGFDNRIEGNNCTQADRGIECDIAGNIILRNTCSSNGINWVLAADNVFGTIVDRGAPGSAAVNGSSAASSAGTTDPWANFSY